MHWVASVTNCLAVHNYIHRPVLYKAATLIWESMLCRVSYSRSCQQKIPLPKVLLVYSSGIRQFCQCSDLYMYTYVYIFIRIYSVVHRCLFYQGVYVDAYVLRLDLAVMVLMIRWLSEKFSNINMISI